jgi:1,4-dihydroxy-2-naphthoate octaprenyltransferase
LPIALSIFNVILINEYLDYVGDARAGKTNLLVRIGKVKAAYVYCAALIIAASFIIHQFVHGLAAKGLAAAIPAVIISGFVGVLLLQGAYENRKRLELLCGLTIVVNLLYSLAYIVALL